MKGILIDEKLYKIVQNGVGHPLRFNYILPDQLWKKMDNDIKLQIQ